jgi:CysZ protein
MPTFRDGLGSLVFGLRFLFRRPEALPLAAVPMLVVVALSGLSIFASLRWALPAIAALLPAAESELGRGLLGLVSWLAAALVATLGIVLALVLGPPLSAPALERLVTLVEDELGAPPRPAMGWAHEMWLGLRASLIGLLIFSPPLLVCSLLELVFPMAAVVTLPLRLVFSSLSVAYALFDYPQSLRGYPIRSRLRLLRRALAPILGFGAGCSALFWFPCSMLLVLPIGVIAATQLFHRIAEASPERR